MPFPGVREPTDDFERAAQARRVAAREAITRAEDADKTAAALAWIDLALNAIGESSPLDVPSVGVGQELLSAKDLPSGLRAAFVEQVKDLLAKTAVQLAAERERIAKEG